MARKNYLYDAISEGLGEGYKLREARMAQLAKQKQDEEDLQIERALGKQRNVPDYVFDIKDPKQRQFWLEQHLKPKSLGEHVTNIADKIFGTGRSSQGMSQNQMPTIIRGNNNEPLAIQVGGQIVPTDQISPETVQHIEMLEQQQAQQSQHDSTFGTKAGNFLTGLGTRAVSLASGGDTAGLLGSGVNALRKLVETPETREAEKSKWAERLKGLSPQQISSLAQEGAFNELASPEEVSEAAMDFVPTANTLRKGLGKVVEGTAAEKYIASKNSTDEIWRELGDIAGIFSNPLQGSVTALKSGAPAIEKSKDVVPFVKKILGNAKDFPAQQLPNITKNILKASGVALTGKGAGWLTEAITGSEKLGKYVQNGIYLGYSLFPGFAKSLGKKAYNEFDNQVINPAIQQGKKVDLNPLRDQLRDTGSLGKKIERLSQHSQAGSFLRDEKSILQDTLQEADGLISPDALWTNIKEMGERLASGKTPDQAKGILKEMIKMQEDALKKFSDTIVPEGGKLLEKANDFWRTYHAIDDARQVVAENLNPRSFNAGAAFWLSGGYKALMKLSIAESARQFATKMMQSPAVRDAMGKLFKASTAQNAALTKKALDDLQSSSDKVLEGLPAKDRAEIIKALKESQRAQES
jgi:hypothetical protein